MQQDSMCVCVRVNSAVPDALQHNWHDGFLQRHFSLLAAPLPALTYADQNGAPEFV